MHPTSSRGRASAEQCRPVELALDQLHWHEQIEPDRLAGLTARLARESLQQPIHAVRWGGGGHLIVDGAHRARALRLLGHRSVAGHVLTVDPGQEVLGWTHLVTDEAGRQLLERARASTASAGSSSRPVAQVTGPLGSDVIWSGSRWASDRLLEVRAVAALYQADSYQRQPPGAPLPRGRWALTWVLPRWGELCALVASHGAFPAGVTRLGGVIDAVCPGRGVTADVRRSA